MCQITHNIKFCTCIKTNIDELDNFWVVYRYNDKNDRFIVGEPIIPIDDINFKVNNETLLKRLKEEDAFDITIHFEEKDVFEMVINNLKEDRKVFNFEYLEKEWHIMEYDPFYIMNKFDAFTSGKVKVYAE